MRDLFYCLQDRDLPNEDNPGWEKMKAKRNVTESISYVKEKYGKL